MATESRTSRFAGGVAMAAFNHVLILAVGLWLTRFVLDRVGQVEYGTWLVALQVMAYLALADLGVVAVLPREVAFAGARGDGGASVRHLLGETTRIALWQMPLVALAAVVLWVAIPSSWTSLSPVLAPVLLVFVLTFPLRGLQAALQGLQDLRYVGAVQLASWSLGTLVIVLALWNGAGIMALAAGWVTGQVVTPVACWWRLRRRFPECVPAALPPVDRASMTAHVRRALWVSLGQVTTLLSSGVDLLIIGVVLGPAAVVTYAVTGKLISVASNLPSLLAHTAGPGLSELREQASRERRLPVATALMQAVVLPSGLIACVVLLVNQGFVAWWVGAHLDGGRQLTALLAAVMVLRHWGTTVVFSVYSFGHERRLAFAGLGEGLVTVVATFLLVRWLGLVGAPLGALVAIVTVTLPLTLPTLAAEAGTSVSSLIGRHGPWLWRMLLLVGLIASAQGWVSIEGPMLVALAALAVTALYGALMLPLALRPPLRSYVLQARDAILPPLGRRAATDPPAP